MNRIILMIFGLALLVNLSRQDCTDLENCVYSGQNCTGVPEGHCCRQAAQVLALAAASARASAYALAGCEASAYACVGVEADGFTSAAASAHVCIAQSVCLSVNTGQCCEISSEIRANASAYTTALAQSSASARAHARAAASASASASAAADSAASLHAIAQALIESSCCNFNLRIHALVEAVGNFSSKASVATETAVSVSTSANTTATVITEATDSITISTGVLLSNGLDNCCVANQTRLLAEDTASDVKTIVDELVDFQPQINEAFDGIESAVEDFDEIIDPVELEDLICTAECNAAYISCCEIGSDEVGDNVCLAARVYVNVTMETRAFAGAFVRALAYAYAAVNTRAEALSSIRLAANAAVNASLGVDVNVKACCSIVVTVSTRATGTADAVGTAMADANAAAEAYAGGYAEAYAIGQSFSEALAGSFAFASLSFQEGCTNMSSECCDIAREIQWADAYDIAQDLKESVDACTELAEAYNTTRAVLNSEDTARVISIVSTQTAYLLQCCCCTKPPTTSTTVRLTYASTGSTLGFTRPTWRFG